MTARFEFYEVVEVESVDQTFSEIAGLEGVVLGMAEDESGEWYYSVLIDQADVGYPWFRLKRNRQA